MATTRKAQPDVEEIEVGFGDELDPDPATDPRDSALAALLVTPMSEITPPEVPVRTVKPPLTGTTVSYTDDGGVRYLVWADVYARMVGEERRGARRGDIVVVPDDELTASHVQLGHLIPE